MSANLARVPAFMRDLADVAQRVLVGRLHIDPALAAEIGLQIARDACAEHAGEMLYIPAGMELNIDDRDRDMYAFYLRCGKDVNQVARKFERSVKQIYERVRLYEAMLQAENQGALFDEADEADASSRS